MITFYDSNNINTANINTADEALKSQIKKFLLDKYKLDVSKFDHEDPVSVDQFGDYFLDLYLLGF